MYILFHYIRSPEDIHCSNMEWFLKDKKYNSKLYFKIKKKFFCAFCLVSFYFPIFSFIPFYLPVFSFPFYCYFHSFTFENIKMVVWFFLSCYWVWQNLSFCSYTRRDFWLIISYEMYTKQFAEIKLYSSDFRILTIAVC